MAKYEATIIIKTIIMPQSECMASCYCRNAELYLFFLVALPVYNRRSLRRLANPDSRDSRKSNRHTKKSNTGMLAHPVPTMAVTPLTLKGDENRVATGYRTIGMIGVPLCPIGRSLGPPEDWVAHRMQVR